jgi:phosphoserine phosphatase
MRKPDVNYKLIFFDLDGTLIKCKSSWELVHEKFNTLPEARKALEEYRIGRITYQEFMVKDVSSWLRKKKSIHISEIEKILDNYELNEGAENTISEIKRKGIRVVILSAGINLLTEKVGQRLGVYKVFSNRLEVDHLGYLTGRGIEVVDPYRKDILLRNTCKIENLPLHETVAVGDTIYDLNMLMTAGLGFYFGNAEDIKHKNIKAIYSLEEILTYLS